MQISVRITISIYQTIFCAIYQLVGTHKKSPRNFHSEGLPCDLLNYQTIGVDSIIDGDASSTSLLTSFPYRLKLSIKRPASWLAFRSEEHTSELQSLMRISDAVFCLTQTENIRQRQTTN